eukprot:3243859-Rhodomonas_salina.1
MPTGLLTGLRLSGHGEVWREAQNTRHTQDNKGPAARRVGEDTMQTTHSGQLEGRVRQLLLQQPPAHTLHPQFLRSPRAAPRSSLRMLRTELYLACFRPTSSPPSSPSFLARSRSSAPFCTASFNPSRLPLSYALLAFSWSCRRWFSSSLASSFSLSSIFVMALESFTRHHTPQCRAHTWQHYQHVHCTAHTAANLPLSLPQLLLEPPHLRPQVHDVSRLFLPRSLFSDPTVPGQPQQLFQHLLHNELRVALLPTPPLLLHLIQLLQEALQSSLHRQASALPPFCCGLLNLQVGMRNFVLLALRCAVALE